MKSVIHPDFENIRAELVSLIKGDYTPLKTFCNKRNTVQLVSVAGRKMVLKKYKPNGWVTGLIYTLFRKSKARRAYEHAITLTSLGFDTPQPIAYFEDKRAGIFRQGYFVCDYADLPSVEQIFYSDKERLNKDEHLKMAHSLSRYTLSLHNAGVLPLDFNTGNILFSQAGDKYDFTLIDINRMKFGKIPGLKKAMISFFQLGTYPHDYLGLLEPYVWERQFNFEEALYEVLKLRRKQSRWRRFKGFFKPAKKSL